MDKEDIRKLYEQYAYWVFKRAKSLLKNEEEARDVVQDVFVKIMHAGASFRNESSPWTWIYRITTNHCLNLIRSKNTRYRIEDTLKKTLPVVTENSPMRDDFFVKLVEKLDKKTQPIVFAYYRDGLTQEEIGIMLDMSRKTVGQKLAKFEEMARHSLIGEKI